MNDKKQLVHDAVVNVTITAVCKQMDSLNSHVKLPEEHIVNNLTIDVYDRVNGSLKEPIRQRIIGND